MKEVWTGPRSCIIEDVQNQSQNILSKESEIFRYQDGGVKIQFGWRRMSGRVVGRNLPYLYSGVNKYSEIQLLT